MEKSITVILVALAATALLPQLGWAQNIDDRGGTNPPVTVPAAPAPSADQPRSDNASKPASSPTHPPAPAWETREGVEEAAKAYFETRRNNAELARLAGDTGKGKNTIKCSYVAPSGKPRTIIMRYDTATERARIQRWIKSNLRTMLRDADPRLETLPERFEALRGEVIRQRARQDRTDAVLWMDRDDKDSPRLKQHETNIGQIKAALDLQLDGSIGTRNKLPKPKGETFNATGIYVWLIILTVLVTVVWVFRKR